MKIKLQKALKLKNKLVSQINKNQELIVHENRFVAGNTPVVKIQELIEKNQRLIDFLVELKSKIHKANIGVYEKIFRLSEKKSWLSKIQSMDIKEGKARDGYERELTDFACQLKYDAKQEIIRGLEEDIDAIQDELDAFNVKNSIDISFEEKEIK